MNRAIILIISICVSVTIVFSGCNTTGPSVINTVEPEKAQTPAAASEPTVTTLPTQKPLPTPRLLLAGENLFNNADFSLNGCSNSFVLSDKNSVYINYGVGVDIFDVKSGAYKGIELASDNSDLLCVYKGYVYYLDEDGFSIRRMKVDSLKESAFYALPKLENKTQIYDFNYLIAGHYIFFCYEVGIGPLIDGEESGYIPQAFRLDLDTGKAETLEADEYLTFMTYAYDGQSIYCEQYDGKIKDNAIYRFDMELENKTEIAQIHNNRAEMLLYSDGRLYYFQNPNDGFYNQICSVNTDGSDQIKAISLLPYDKYGGTVDVNIAGNYIYYINEDDNETLYRVRTDGICNEKISDITGIEDVDIAAGRLFFHCWDDSNNYYSMLPDGSDLVLINVDQYS